MATLLTMLNDLRALLSEEPIATISATDGLTQALILLVNKASKSVLESRTWSFDKRTDGEAAIDGPVAGSTVNHIAGPGFIVEYSAAAFAMLTPNTMAVRFNMDDDTVRPKLSYAVVNAARFGPLLSIVLSSDWLGEQGVSDTGRSWTLYTTDYILPSTVRKVLSVRDEEQPIQLYFTEDEIFTDRYSPRPLDDTGEGKCVIVGGTETASFATGSASTGMRLRMLPVPVSDTMLYYTYVYRHPAMTAATDTLVAVPGNVIRLIVDKALYYCLSSNVEADMVRARRVESKYRVDFAVAATADRTAPNRRRVMDPGGAIYARHPNSRWDSREVPSP